MPYSFKIYLINATLLLSTFCAQQAFGDAWGRQKGSLFTATTLRHFDFDKSWTKNNHTKDADHYRETKIENFMEYGLTDALSVGNNVTYLFTDPEHGPHRNAFNEVEFWGHYKIHKWEQKIISGQMLINFHDVEKRFKGVQGHQPGFEPRLFYGQYWKNWLNGVNFFDTSIAYRYNPGRNADQIRFDMKFGIETGTKKWLFMIESLNKISPRNQHHRPYSDYDLAEIAPSITHRFTDHISLQLGYKHAIYGRRIAIGSEPFLSLWTEF